MNMNLSKLQGHSEGQGSLVCCSPWGCRESDLVTEKLLHYVTAYISNIQSLSFWALKSVHVYKNCVEL